MKMPPYFRNNSAGFALIELLMVMIIIGALASIAIPHYAEYREKAMETRCQANRHHIEMEELAYYTEKNEPSLVINDIYRCPSGGTYVWLVMDPEDPRYPQIGCSMHFTGNAMETSTQPQPTPTTDSDTTEEDEKEDLSAAQLIDEVIAYVNNLNLSKKLTNLLISKLNNALKNLEKGKTNNTVNNLNNFTKTAQNERKKGNIESEESDILISKAEEIIKLL